MTKETFVAPGLRAENEKLRQENAALSKALKRLIEAARYMVHFWPGDGKDHTWIFERLYDARVAVGEKYARRWPPMPDAEKGESEYERFRHGTPVADEGEEVIE